MKFFRNLYRSRHGLFYYRKVLPGTIRAIVGRSEVRRSLRTQDPQEALQRALAIDEKLKGTIAMMVVNNPNFGDLQKHHPAVFYEIGRFVLGNLEIHNFAPNPSNPLEAKLMRAITEKVRTATVSTPAILALPPPTNPLDQAIAEYLEHGEKRRHWAPGTIKENEQTLRILAAHFEQSKSLSSITREDLKYFIAILEKLPPNYAKAKKYDGLAPKDIADTSGVANRGMNTLRKQIGTLSGFFGWASDEGYIGKNPVKGLSPKKTKRARDERDLFTESDLETLFKSLESFKGSSKPSRYWVPLIAYYTGARLEEICQLDIGDIQECSSSGVWFVDINEEGDKSLKNRNSCRKVPLHSALIEAGIIQYMIAVQATGTTKLFPELKPYGGKYSHEFSKWFGRHKRAKGIVDGTKTFHSLRHNQANALRRAGVPKEVIEALQGRTRDGDVGERYSKDFPLTRLAGAINELPRPVAVDETVGAGAVAQKTGEAHGPGTSDDLLGS